MTSKADIEKIYKSLPKAGRLTGDMPDEEGKAKGEVVGIEWDTPVVPLTDTVWQAREVKAREENVEEGIVTWTCTWGDRSWDKGLPIFVDKEAALHWARQQKNTARAEDNRCIHDWDVYDQVMADLLAERRKQIDKGYHSKHDIENHSIHEMLMAARTYLQGDSELWPWEDTITNVRDNIAESLEVSPYHPDYKILVKAGAMVISALEFYRHIEDHLKSYDDTHDADGNEISYEYEDAILERMDGGIDQCYCAGHIIAELVCGDCAKVSEPDPFMIVRDENFSCGHCKSARVHKRYRCINCGRVWVACETDNR